MNIGVIGLGIIGTEWAKHYAAAGKLAGVWNRTPQPDFPTWKATPEDVTSAVDVVHIVVADPRPSVIFSRASVHGSGPARSWCSRARSIPPAAQSLLNS